MVRVVNEGHKRGVGAVRCVPRHRRRRSRTYQARIADEQRFETVGEGNTPVKAVIPFGLVYLVGDTHVARHSRAEARGLE
jgi:hypothetical protein